MTAFYDLIETFRNHARSEREKGTYFEQLCIQYFKNEPYYADLFTTVEMYGDWAKTNGLSAKDTGIDLVATTRSGEAYAIQCKLYATGYKLQKSDIDSFFTAASKKYFAHRIIISTTNNWSVNALDALDNQDPPVIKIDLNTLENSVIDWSQFAEKKTVHFKAKKQLREHQKAALTQVKVGLYEQGLQRGKLIMACGTGKTFTSLKIAEECAGKGKRVLFLVPSLSLLSQTLTEWTQESDTPLHSFAVCSDTEVGKKVAKGEVDIVSTLAHELQYPATTVAVKLAEQIEQIHDQQHMTVVFSTYHSIHTVSDAQNEYGLPEFDLIICDEAHRTTGATYKDDPDSNFVKIHDAGFILGKKRIYMTATPKIYSDDIQENAKDFDFYSMDNPDVFGETLYTINFSEAVKRGLLVDYKVIVLTVDSDTVIDKIGATITENSDIVVDDAARIVGCWKALSKQGIHADVQADTAPMQRALAFCQVIEQTAKARKHQVSSKNIASIFQTVVEAYQAAEEKDGNEISHHLLCQAQHVDGSMGADLKEQKLNWLKAEPEPQFDAEGNARPVCRVLSNVRCLSEGVDVPALDAVLFLTPRNSQVDVVQSVGRVMRLAPNKQKGYVILPVVIPPKVDAHKALDDNKTYKVVWQVLNALRSHDDRFDAMINKMDLTGIDHNKMEVIAISDKVKAKSKSVGAGKGGKSLGRSNTKKPAEASNDETKQVNFSFEEGEIERAIVAKVVQKVGNRHHWEDWANDIAKIAQTHIQLINDILKRPECEHERAVFNAFAHELRDDLNNAVSDAEVIEMLAQHLITKPVFDALFDEYSFAAKNPMALAMQKVLDVLQQHHLDSETQALKRFYDSVKLRASGIDNAEGKQKIIVELYDKFFRNAFPKMTEKLGIVYTPVEVVDFILHSVNDVLKQEFGQTIGSKGVHVIDPFTGTGTFISRLIQSDLISNAELVHKYKHELHANEIVLLAYYIAAINIEASYHGRVIDEYTPFQGICLTDTFQMYEKDDLVSTVLVDNSARRTKQKNLDIRVIVGNPPYSSGQDSANDNNANVSYPYLDARIRETYAERSNATNKNALYNSYIRAVRWASDRIGNQGVIGFISGNGFVDKPVMSGLRQCLADEFSSLYIFNLRGDVRKNMLSKGKAKEGQNVFGSGSMSGIAISVLIKNPASEQKGKIHYYDIGDDLSSSEKLQKITDLVGMATIEKTQSWQVIEADQHGDWLNKRDDRFNDFIGIGDKKEKINKYIFETYSCGLQSNRDTWVYNHSKNKLTHNMTGFIDFYNSEVRKFKDFKESSKNQTKLNYEVSFDATKIKWSSSLLPKVEKGIFSKFEKSKIYVSLYRPFNRQWVYFDAMFNHRPYLMPKLFPNTEADNLLIMINGRGSRNGMSTLVTRVLPDLNNLEAGTQTFPLYTYETQHNTTQHNTTQHNTTQHNIIPETNNFGSRKFGYLYFRFGGKKRFFSSYIFLSDRPAYFGHKPMLSDVYLRRGERQLSESISQRDLFAQPKTSVNTGGAKKLVRRDAITDEGLAHFADYYAAQANGETISKQDLFYYIYGLLHSEDYRSRYADNLSKELPRIPRVKTYAHFRHFSQAGRELAHYHLNYETVEPYPVRFNTNLEQLSDADFYVTKMKFAKGTGEQRHDKTTVIYNHKITLSGIPLEAYDYVVNGKAALDWVMERQAVKTDKDSGIVNDANDWAIETMNNPRYPLELLQRVITVSLETLKIVNALPKLDIE